MSESEYETESDVDEPEDTDTTTANVITVENKPAAAAASVPKKSVPDEQNDHTDTEEDDEDDEDDESEQEEDNEEELIPNTPTAEVISILDSPAAAAASVPKKTVPIEQNDLVDTEEEDEDDEDDESEQEEDDDERDPSTSTVKVISIPETLAPAAASFPKKTLPNEQNDLVDTEEEDEDDVDTEEEDEDDEREDEYDHEERNPNSPTAEVISIPETPAAAVASIQKKTVQNKQIDLAETEEEDEDDIFEDDGEEESEDDCFADDKVDTMNNDDEYEENPELVHLPFITKGFKWRQLMPESFYKRQHKKKPLQVGPDLVSSGKSVSVSDMRRRCRYTNKDPNDRVNIDKARDDIDDLVKKIKINIQVIICKFLMTIATYLKFGINQTSGIVENWDDFVIAVEGVDNDVDGKKVTTICYLVFDFMLHWQVQVTEIVCQRLNIKIVDREIKKKDEPRQLKDFMYKLGSYVLNYQRKIINTFASKSSGQKYTIVRWGIHVLRKKSKYDSRKKKHFYEWMIMVGDGKNGKPKRKRQRKNNRGLKNDWYAIPDDNVDIMMEAGVSSVRKREQRCEERERMCDDREESLDGKPKARKKKREQMCNDREDSLDGKPKARKKKKNNHEKIVLNEERLVKASKTKTKKKKEAKNAIGDDDFWNSDADVHFSPGQLTVGNDSLIDGYSQASVYSAIKPAGRIFDVTQVSSKFCGKVDELNDDMETNEAIISWQIERDWNAPFFRRSSKILVKNIKKRDLRIEEICNVRKQSGFEGEVLVRWNSGERDWCYVSVIMAEHQCAYVIMVTMFLASKNISFITLEFGLYKTQVLEEEEKIREEERKLQEAKELQEMDNIRKIQTNEKVNKKTASRVAKNQLPMKRKLVNEFGKENKKVKVIKELKKGTRASYRINKNIITTKQNNVLNPSSITVTIPRKVLKNKDKSLNPAKQHDTIIEVNTDDEETDEKNPGVIDAVTKNITEAISQPDKSHDYSSPNRNLIEVNNPVSEAKSYPSLVFESDVCSQHSDDDDELNPQSFNLNQVTIMAKDQTKQEDDKLNPDHSSLTNPKKDSDHDTLLNPVDVSAPTTLNLVDSTPNPDLVIVNQLNPEDIVKQLNPEVSKVNVKKRKNKKEKAKQLDPVKVSAPNIIDLLNSPPNPESDIVKQLNPEVKKVDVKKRKNKKDKAKELNPDKVSAPIIVELQHSPPNPELDIVEQLNPEVEKKRKNKKDKAVKKNCVAPKSPNECVTNKIIAEASDVPFVSESSIDPTKCNKFELLNPVAEVVTQPNTKTYIMGPILPQNPTGIYELLPKPKPMETTNSEKVNVKKKIDVKKRKNKKEKAAQLNQDKVSAPIIVELQHSPPNPVLDIVEQLNPEVEKVDVKKRKNKEEKGLAGKRSVDQTSLPNPKNHSVNVTLLNPEEVLTPKINNLDVSPLNPDPNPKIVVSVDKKNIKKKKKKVATTNPDEAGDTIKASKAKTLVQGDEKKRSADESTQLNPKVRSDHVTLLNPEEFSLLTTNILVISPPVMFLKTSELDVNMKKKNVEQVLPDTVSTNATVVEKKASTSDLISSPNPITCINSSISNSFTNQTTAMLITDDYRGRLALKIKKIQNERPEGEKLKMSEVIFMALAEVRKIELKRHPDNAYIESDKFTNQLFKNVRKYKDENKYKNCSGIVIAINEIYLLDKAYQKHLLDGVNKKKLIISIKRKPNPKEIIVPADKPNDKVPTVDDNSVPNPKEVSVLNPKDNSEPNPKKVSVPNPEKIIVPDKPNDKSPTDDNSVPSRPKEVSVLNPKDNSEPNPKKVSVPIPETIIVPDKPNDKSPTDDNSSVPSRPKEASVLNPKDDSEPNPKKVSVPNPEKIIVPDKPNDKSPTDDNSVPSRPKEVSVPNPKDDSVLNPKEDIVPDKPNDKGGATVDSVPSPKSVSVPNPKDFSVPKSKTVLNPKETSVPNPKEGNSGYCKEDYRFFGVQCQGEGCTVMFVPNKTTDLNTFKPTSTLPMYCCINTKDECPYALCNNCYTKKALA